MDYRKKHDGNINFHKRINRAFPKNGLSFLCTSSNERDSEKLKKVEYEQKYKLKIEEHMALIGKKLEVKIAGSKEKLVTERGITLLALIITVVIMIILAAVTINVTLGDGGLIKQAQLSKDLTENSVMSEQEYMNRLMQEYANVMEEDKELPLPDKGWHYDEDGNITDGEVTLKIGDYVNYDEQDGATVFEYTSPIEMNGSENKKFLLTDTANDELYPDFGWRILGIESNQLIIMPNYSIGYSSRPGVRVSEFEFYGEVGYSNYVEELNNICSIYGKGKYATKARSINMADFKNELISSDTSISDKNYNSNITYYWDGTDSLYYEMDNGSSGKTVEQFDVFYWYEEGEGIKYSNKSLNATEQTKEKIVTLTNKARWIDLKPDLFGLDDFFVADKGYCIENISYLGFGIGSKYGLLVDYDEKLIYSNGSEDTVARNILPVVSLQSDIILEDSGTKQDGCTLWNIVGTE